MDRRLDVVLIRGASMPQSIQGSDTQTNGLDALRRFLLHVPQGPFTILTNSRRLSLPVGQHSTRTTRGE
jgi:hypothetical protein